MSLSVSRARLLADHAELAGIGLELEAGVTRLAYSPEDQAARGWLLHKLEALGLRVRVDEVGNVEGRPALDALGPESYVLSGSHFDSVRQGGAYDGALGVACALEAVRTLLELDRSTPVGVVGFAAEESTRFGIGCVGTRAMVGDLRQEDLDLYAGSDGTSLRKAMVSCGLSPDRLEGAMRVKGWAGAFLELHIDQGAELLEAGCPIGIVTAIAGPLRLKARIQGEAAHSGGTRMQYRKDALAAGAEVVLALEEMARTLEPQGAWATVGDLEVYPGAFNTVPGAVVLSVEIRAIDEGVMGRARRALEAVFRRVAQKRNVQVTWDVVSFSKPAAVPGWLADLLETVCEKLGVSWVRLPSRAAHDAMYISRLAPAGMILVRNRSGLSHSAREAVDPEDIVTGANVLAHALQALALEIQLRGSGTF